MKAVFFNTLKCRITFILFAIFNLVSAQDKDSSKSIDSWIANRQFVFKAQTATPQTSRLIQLNYLYDLRISGDSIISYLPYYGRAFVAPINTEDAGLSFTSTDYSYQTEKVKDGKWEVTIATKALRDNYKLFFTIYNNGQADLQVTSSNRQPIRFNGEVVAKAAK